MIDSWATLRSGLGPWVAESFSRRIHSEASAGLSREAKCLNMAACPPSGTAPNGSMMTAPRNRSAAAAAACMAKWPPHE